MSGWTLHPYGGTVHVPRDGGWHPLWRRPAMQRRRLRPAPDLPARPTMLFGERVLQRLMPLRQHSAPFHPM